MNRRDFLSRLDLFRNMSRHDKRAELDAREASLRDDLYRLAMARGIDPATVTPEQLPELLGLKAGE